MGVSIDPKIEYIVCVDKANNAQSTSTPQSIETEICDLASVTNSDYEVVLDDFYQLAVEKDANHKCEVDALDTTQRKWEYRKAKIDRIAESTTLDADSLAGLIALSNKDGTLKKGIIDGLALKAAGGSEGARLALLEWAVKEPTTAPDIAVAFAEKCQNSSTKGCVDSLETLARENPNLFTDGKVLAVLASGVMEKDENSYFALKRIISNLPPDSLKILDKIIGGVVDGEKGEKTLGGLIGSSAGGNVYARGIVVMIAQKYPEAIKEDALEILMAHGVRKEGETHNGCYDTLARILVNIPRSHPGYDKVFDELKNAASNPQKPSLRAFNMLFYIADNCNDDQKGKIEAFIKAEADKGNKAAIQATKDHAKAQKK